MEAPIGNAFGPSFDGESVMGPPEPVTGKRKPSPSEDKIAGETEEQKQKRARGRPRLDTKDETAADVSTGSKHPRCGARASNSG